MWKKQKKTEQKGNGSYLKTNAEIFPFRFYDEQMSCFVLANGTYNEFLKKNV